MRGAPLKAIQELLGHATIEMTMRYAHLSPGRPRDAVRMLELPARCKDVAMGNPASTKLIPKQSVS